MTLLSFAVDWLDPPPPGYAFGPEVTTWARLSIFLDDECLTRNHDSDTRATSEERDHVVGPMSGLVEWLVETRPYILWDIHVPFEPFASGPGNSRVPSLRDAQQGWHQYGDHLERTELALWQHRHSLGHGTSNLALPSIVLLPDIRRIGIAIDYGPPSLDPSVRFSPQGSAWPTEPIWLAKDEAVAELEHFVNECIERARASAETRQWAAWVDDRWKRVREKAADPAFRRELLYGPLVAEAWDEVTAKLGQRTGMLEGILLDTRILRSKDSLERFVAEISQRPDENGTWAELASGPVDSTLPPYAQGYALAVRVRDFLGRRTEPLVDLRAVLETMGISLFTYPESPAFFRSAVTSEPDGRARVLYDDAGETSRVRFSISAALGRLLGEFSGNYFGAAHGSNSRWEQTQRANAFAAELLLPRAGLEHRDPGDLDQITEVYGISRSAARWHVHNRLGGMQDRIA